MASRKILVASAAFSLTSSCPLLFMKGALKVLSGKQVAGILGKFGFTLRSSSRNHLKLRRVGIEGKET
jgi:hypothetical protein